MTIDYEITPRPGTKFVQVSYMGSSAWAVTIDPLCLPAFIDSQRLAEGIVQLLKEQEPKPPFEVRGPTSDTHLHGVYGPGGLWAYGPSATRAQELADKLNRLAEIEGSA
jgi:hypothetical protein